MSQPQPTPTTGEPIWDAVIADMQARDALGRERYGTPLQAHNGRKALQDAYEEALDLAVYLKQEIIERKDKAMKRRFQKGDNVYCTDEHGSYRGIVQDYVDDGIVTIRVASGSIHTVQESELSESKPGVEPPTIDFASIKPGDELTIRVKALRVDVDDGDCHVTAWTGESESIWINRDDIVSHDPLPRPATASEFYAMPREQQERWLAEMLKGGA